jgi:hypothetical protein
MRGLGVTNEPGIIPIFPGWNVWSLWQVNDLDFSVMNIGVTEERQLRIWVEDQIRDKAGAAEVADPVALKGSQIQMLPSLPTGLRLMMRKEQVQGCEGDGCAGPTMVVDGPATLKTVRFFNRSNSQTSMPWPHDDNYLVDSVYIPNVDNIITAGPGPGTVLDPLTKGAADAAGAAGGVIDKVIMGALVIGGVYLAITFAPLIVAALQRSSKSKT